MQYDSGHNRSSTSLLTVLLALLLGAFALAIFLRHATSGPMARIASLIDGRTTTIGSSVPAVVEKIRRLNRLETVVYSLDTVVEGNRSSPLLPDVLAGDHILLVVHGQSIAGIDLSQLKPEDVAIVGSGSKDSPAGESITVTLPPSQVFITALDDQHTSLRPLHRPARSCRSKSRVRHPRQGPAAVTTGRALRWHPRRCPQERPSHRHRTALLTRLRTRRCPLSLFRSPFPLRPASPLRASGS